MLKKSFLVGLLASIISLPVNANELSDGLGVELIVNDALKGKKVVSLYAISHFNGVKDANDVFKANDLDVNLVADKIVYDQYDDSIDTAELGKVMLLSMEDRGWENKPFLSVVISQAKSNSLGEASRPLGDARFDPSSDRPYLTKPHHFISMNSSTMYGGSFTYNSYHTLAHEIGHTFGARHETSERELLAGEDPFYYAARAATQCANGTKPLMTAIGTKYNAVPLITGSVNCPLLNNELNPNGEVMQRFYNSTQQDSYPMKDRTPNTLGFMVTENTNTQQFDFVIERTTTESENGTLFIAGNGVGLTPINFSFADNEMKKTINIDFSDLHEVMTASDQNLKIGNDIESTVYAVAQTESEVVKNSYDVSAINTQWKPKSKDKDGDNGSNGSSGGSSSFGFLAVLLGLAWSRKRS